MSERDPQEVAYEKAYELYKEMCAERNFPPLPIANWNWHLEYNRMHAARLYTKKVVNA